MGSPSRNVQYHPPRLSEDRLNLPQPHSPSFAYTLLREIGNAPIVNRPKVRVRSWRVGAAARSRRSSRRCRTAVTTTPRLKRSQTPRVSKYWQRVLHTDSGITASIRVDPQSARRRSSGAGPKLFVTVEESRLKTGRDPHATESTTRRCGQACGTATGTAP